MRGISSFLYTTLAAIIIGLVVNEMSTLSPHFAAKLLRWGARRYGTSDVARKRYTEE
jgi:hypothetical protein